jgi:hypothetical protein
MAFNRIAGGWHCVLSVVVEASRDDRLADAIASREAV